MIYRITEFTDPIAEPTQCRWPVDQAPSGEHLFCGRPVSIHGGSWCDEHAKRGRESWPPTGRRRLTRKRELIGVSA